MGAGSSLTTLSKIGGLLLLLAIGSWTLPAQQWDLLAEGALDHPVRLGAIDRFGSFYLNDVRGTITKLDSLGTAQSRYAPPHYGELTSIEPWTALRVFLFYQDIQQYAFLDRFLNPAEFIRLPQDLFGMSALACPSSDNQLWVLDTSPLNLVKYDFNFNTSTLNQPLHQLADTLKLDPYHLIEYQNRLYLGDRDLGILVFDNLGNYLHTLPKTGAEIFYPFKEEFYFLSNGKLNFIGLYRDSLRSVDLPSSGSSFQMVLLTGRKALLLSGKSFALYAYKP